MVLIYLATWTHAHIYSWKLGPGLVLFAKVCPWIENSAKTYFRVSLKLRASLISAD